MRTIAGQGNVGHHRKVIGSHPAIEILGKDEPIDPSLVLVRFEGQGGAMRAREVHIDFAAIEAELAAA